MTDHMSLPGTARYVTDIVTPLRDRVALLPGSRDRQNRPIVFFPSAETSANSDDLKNILNYFHAVTADDCKKNGFIFIIGTRKGTTRQAVKPILRSIQDFFPGPVAGVLVIKQDNFLDKLKFNSSSNKYKFDVHEISIENLTRFIDSAQLLKEFGGSLYYDHEEWIELRRDIERVVQRLSDALRDCEAVHSALQSKIHSEETGWPSGAGTYDELETRLNAIDAMDCEYEIQKVQQKIMMSADEGYNSAATLKTPNPDLAAVIPHLTHLGKSVYKSKTELSRRYNETRIEQDRWKQFKIFEQDVVKFKDWILQNTKAVELRFPIIGNNLEELTQMIHENDGLVESTENAKVNLEHIERVGRTLIDASNVGKSQIDAMLKDIEHSWSYYTVKLDQRATLLSKALEFRKKTERFFKSYPQWDQTLKSFPDDITNKGIQDLEKDIQTLETIGNEIELAYTEGFNETNILSDTMKMQFGQEKVGRTESFLHVLDVTKKLAKAKREIQSIYEEKKDKYCLKLSFEAFLAESKSVMEWLTGHGEPFLRKKTAIGENTDQAKHLANHHESFQRVASNTYRNAQQLFQVGTRLRSSGDYDNDNVRNRLSELKAMIDGFTTRVQHRAELLKLSTMFHLHHEEIMRWYDELANRTRQCETVPDSDEAADLMIDKLLRENDATVAAFNTVMSESAQLVGMLRKQREMLGTDISGSVAHIEQITTEIKARHTTEMEREPYQRSCVLAGKKLGIFMAECVDIYQKLLLWRDDLKELLAGATCRTNQHDTLIRFHEQNIRSVHEVSDDIVTKFQDFIQTINNEGLNLMDSDERPFTEVLVEQSKKLDLLTRDVLSLARDVTNKIILSRDVSQHLYKAEELRRNIQGYSTAIEKLTRTIPGSKTEALRHLEFYMKLKHESERMLLELEQIKSVLGQFAAVCENDRSQRNKVLMEINDLTRAEEQYVYCSAVCEALLSSAEKYYTGYDMLCPIIRDFIDNDNSEQKDYCSGCESNGAASLANHLGNQITKQNKRKEGFLAASLLAQRTADMFTKAIHKCPISRQEKEMKLRQIDRQKHQVTEQQAKVLQILNKRINSIQQCQTAVIIRKATEEALNWLHHDPEVREFKHNKRTIRDLKVLSKTDLEGEIQKLTRFNVVLKEKRAIAADVKRHAGAYLQEHGNSVHANEVSSYYHKIQEEYSSFLRTIKEWEKLLHSAMGDGEESGITERLSDCTLEDKMEQPEGPRPDSQMRMPMLELIDGEKKYIDLLKMLITHYLGGYRKAEAAGKLPPGLKNKERAIFGNIEAVHEFHEKYFLDDLVAYTDNPTDVACAFVNNVERMREIYTEYIVNKDQNLKFVSSPDVVKFFSEIKNRNPDVIAYEKETNQTMNLDSVLMSPIQRIFKYGLLLKRLIELAPYEINEIKEVAETIEEVANYANDYIKVFSLEDYKIHAMGDFIMSGVFTVTEPKRLIKREKEYQVFLFENNIVLAKKEKDDSGSEKYYFKDKIMLSDVFVAEHIDNSNIRFGLRKKMAGNVTSMENTTVFKAENEKTQKRWVKKLRELTVELQHHHGGKKSTTSLDHISSTPTSSNRNSRASRDSCEFSHTTTTTEDGQSLRSQDYGHANNNINKTEIMNFRLSQWPAEDTNGT